jgi:hypothetical protein
MTAGMVLSWIGFVWYFIKWFNGGVSDDLFLSLYFLLITFLVVRAKYFVVEVEIIENDEKNG